MKKHLLLFVVLIFPSLLGRLGGASFGEGWGEVANAQNLVPNPSFEDTVNCPNVFGFSQVAKWYNAEGIPYYYNACNTSPAPNNCSVPQNYLTNRNAATGYAYCSLVNYVSWFTNGRDKIGVQLIDTLKKGKKYNLSFKVSAVQCWKNSLENGASNNLGFLFSTSKYDLSHPSPTKNFCHLKADSIIKDTVGWELISGSFIADSSYFYLTIGNFITDTLTDTLRFFYQQGNPVPLRALVFIDDIFVGYDSTQDHNGIDLINQIDFQIYPNPTADVIHITSNNFSIQQIEIYNNYGIISYHEVFTIPKNNYTIDAHHLQSGVYFLKTLTQHGIQTKKLTIIH
ncbi:MAG: hypothetical protein RL065_944 [Bacteroidota bacterium]|jgi:hypothetical protein